MKVVIFIFFLVGTVLLAIAFLVPSVLKIPNKLWFKFGMLLGVVVSPIVMAVIFFIVVTPIGLIMRTINKDLLRKKINKNRKSYWIKRNQGINTMKQQF